MSDIEYPLTERSIQLAIQRERLNSSKIVCPNYTPTKWWECDLWQVTKAGYATEYEIKMSLADYKIDAAKSMTRYEIRQKIVESKHNLLAARCERGPSRFYYCVPAELAEAIEQTLPAWAGLIVCRPIARWHLARFHVRKDAPRLHGAKVSEQEIDLCKSRMVFRYWAAINDLHKVSGQLSRLERAMVTT